MQVDVMSTKLFERLFQRRPKVVELVPITDTLSVQSSQSPQTVGLNTPPTVTHVGLDEVPSRMSLEQLKGPNTVKIQFLPCEEDKRIDQLKEIDEILNLIVMFEMPGKWETAGALADKLLEAQSRRRIRQGEAIMVIVKKLNDDMLERYLDSIRWLVGRWPNIRKDKTDFSLSA